MLTCWDQVEEIFWFTTCFNFEKGAESPEPSSEFQRLKSQFFIQFSLRSSFYCTSWSKGSIVLYMFNFDTKTFIIRLVIDDVTVVKMWSYERFVNSSKGRSGKGIQKPFYDSNPVICFQNFCINMIMEI